MSKIYSDLGPDNDGDDKLTLWELAGTEAIARTAVDLYGSEAATAAAYCALTAHFDGRRADYRFWCSVFAQLSASPKA